MKITFTGDPMDGQMKVTGHRQVRRYDQDRDKEVVRIVAIEKRHKAEDPESITKFGVKFPFGEAVEVSAEFAAEHGEKFMVNSHFHVESDVSEDDGDMAPRPEGSDEMIAVAGG